MKLGCREGYNPYSIDLGSTKVPTTNYTILGMSYPIGWVAATAGTQHKVHWCWVTLREGLRLRGLNLTYLLSENWSGKQVRIFERAGGTRTLKNPYF